MPILWVYLAAVANYPNITGLRTSLTIVCSIPTFIVVRTVENMDAFSIVYIKFIFYHTIIKNVEDVVGGLVGCENIRCI
jgi:hypothetical protein